MFRSFGKQWEQQNKTKNAAIKDAEEENNDEKIEEEEESMCLTIYLIKHTTVSVHAVELIRAKKINL